MKLKKVLMIDDEELILLTTRLLLQKHGIEVVCSSNSAETVSLAKSTAPDLILLDLMMPDIDGWETLRQLKEDPATSGIPVVLFTAGDFVATENQLREWNVLALIKKPFRLPELLGIITNTGNGATDV